MIPTASDTASAGISPSHLAPMGSSQADGTHEPLVQFTGESAHLASSPSNATWNTGSANHWQALAPISLPLPPHVIRLISEANAVRCPPTVGVRHGNAELRFESYAEFRSRQVSANLTTSLPSGTTSEGVEEILELFQDYQETQLRGLSNEPREATGPRTFSCTLEHGCRRSFAKKGDWKRHENTHYPQEIWLCSHETCTSKPIKHKTFLRRDRFAQHYRDAHGNGNNIPIVAADSYRLAVHGSKWPRKCPFQECPKSNFPSFDDRLEHVAREHFKKKRNHPDVHSWKSSNEDEDQDGFDDGLWDRGSYPRNGSSHGAAYYDSSLSGGNSSGAVSSSNLSGSSGAYWVRERSTAPRRKPVPSRWYEYESPHWFETLAHRSISKPTNNDSSQSNVMITTDLANHKNAADRTEVLEKHETDLSPKSDYSGCDTKVKESSPDNISHSREVTK